MRENWIDAGAFAELASISGQKARRALSRAVHGHTWRGHPLEVREVHGRGGRSGLSYEVSLSSLSGVLENAEHEYLKGLARLAPKAWPPPKRDIPPNQGPARQKREAAILPFYYLEPGSAERLAALEAQAKATGVSVRSLNRWAALYASHGINGLARKLPTDAGRKRVQVSRVFDAAFRAAGYQDDLLERVAEEATRTIKGLWKSRREASGYNAVRRDAETLLAVACEGYGVKLPEVAYRLSRRRVEEFAGYRIVNIYRNDRKRWDDNKPRIRRDWTCLDPMEVVVADVKPLDVMVTRPDGSTVWPKAIGFLDAATFRLFLYIVFLAPGEGVRQEHVHEAFLAMVMDPGWGFPKSLYLDNGTEFGALEKLGDAMALLSEPGARTVIYARPYNASAKPIESGFARLNKLFTCVLPGYAGKDRMVKKTQTVGRPPVAYANGLVQYEADMRLGVDDLNHTPMQGKQYSGRTPVQMMEAAAAKGWRPVMVDPLILDAAFCIFETRKVTKGALKIGGKVYPVPDVPSGSMVSVARPWRRGADPLFRPSSTSAWSYLAEDAVLPADWTDGARESGRRHRSALKAVRKLEADVPEIDPLTTMRIRAGRRVAVSFPKPGPLLDAGDELANVAAALAPRRDGEAPVLTEAERIKRAKDATTRRLQRAYGNG